MIISPPDPTLTVDNVSYVMEKVKDELRPQIWGELSSAIRRVIQQEGYSSEKDPTYADLYANCKSNSLWEIKSCQVTIPLSPGGCS